MTTGCLVLRRPLISSGGGLCGPEFEPPFVLSDGEDELGGALIRGGVQAIPVGARYEKAQIMKVLPVLGLVLATVSNVYGLHFYLDSDEERCFIEELPAGTIVEGPSILFMPFWILHAHEKS